MGETTWPTNLNFRSLLISVARDVGERPSARTPILEFTFKVGQQSVLLRRMTTRPSQMLRSPPKRSSRLFRQLALHCNVVVPVSASTFSYDPRKLVSHPNTPNKAAERCRRPPFVRSFSHSALFQTVRRVANSLRWKYHSVLARVDIGRN
jgi:hypothetical protein